MTDTQKILEAISQLDKRIDEMAERIDRLQANIKPVSEEPCVVTDWGAVVPVSTAYPKRDHFEWI